MLEQVDTTTSTTFEATPLSPTLLAGLRRLSSLEALPSNWDSYGSPPPRRLAVLLARGALASAAALDAPPPVIGPISGGGIHLAWESRDRCIELNLFPDGTCEFLAAAEGNESEGMLDMSDSASLRALLRWFLHSRT